MEPHVIGGGTRSRGNSRGRSRVPMDLIICRRLGLSAPWNRGCRSAQFYVCVAVRSSAVVQAKDGNRWRGRRPKLETGKTLGSTAWKWVLLMEPSTTGTSWANPEPATSSPTAPICLGWVSVWRSFNEELNPMTLVTSHVLCQRPPDRLDGRVAGSPRLGVSGPMDVPKRKDPTSPCADRAAITASPDTR